MKEVKGEKGGRKAMATTRRHCSRRVKGNLDQHRVPSAENKASDNLHNMSNAYVRWRHRWTVFARTAYRLQTVAASIDVMHSSAYRDICLSLFAHTMHNSVMNCQQNDMSRIGKAKARGVATGGGISVYIPPKSVYLNFFWCGCSVSYQGL